MTNHPAPTNQEIVSASAPKNPIAWPDPTPEMLNDTAFNAIWSVIKTWDIAVPEAYGGYCGATGNHVRAILAAARPLIEAQALGMPMTFRETKWLTFNDGLRAAAHIVRTAGQDLLADRIRKLEPKIGGGRPGE